MESDSDLEIVSAPGGAAQDELSSSPIPAPTARPPPRSRKGRASSSPASSPPPPPARRAAATATDSSLESRQPAAKSRAAPAKARPRPKPKPKAALPSRPEDNDFFNMGKRPVVFRTKALGLTELADSGSIVRASTSRSPNLPQDRKSASCAVATEPAVIYLDTDSEAAGSTDEDEKLSGADEDDDGAGERRRKKKAKMKAKKVKMPTWTRSQHVTNPGSSSDVEALVDPEASPRSSAASGPSPERPRKRSRSATPPPRIDQTLIARDLEAVRDSLIRNANGYVKGQSLIGRDQDDEDLLRLMNAGGGREDDEDPVLREVRQKLLRQQQEREKADGTPTANAKGKGVLVKVTVSMTWDPREQWVADATRAAYETPLTLDIATRENLREVFEQLAKKSGLPADSITLALAPSKTGALGKRVFAGETLESVGVYADAELKGYRADVYAYLREQRHGPRSPTRSPTRPASGAQPQTGPGSPSPSPTVATLTITVRRGQKRDLDLTVKKTTSVLAIIKQFLKEDEGLVGELLTRKAKRCTLEFDGERLALDTKVGETELDDGDLCDVVVPDR